MISTLLAATTPALEAAAGAEAEGPAALLHKFGFEWGYIAMQLLSFAILAYVLYRFAIKPTLSQMDERKRQIEAGMKNAEATAAKLAEANAAAAAQLKTAQVEANKIVDEARKASKDLAEREAAAATERANALITKAQQAIELEHKKMLADARTEIARLVVATTERVLAKKLTDADRAAYNEAAANELTSV